jgi:hypothetical protein
MLDKHFSSTRFIWCADIQNDIFEPLYVDAVHYNARASAIFASCITDVISQREILKTGSR